MPKRGPRKLAAERLECRQVLDGSTTLIDINQSGAEALYDKSAVVGTNLYFVDTDRQYGAELRVLDTVTESISLVADINPGFDDAYVGKYGGIAAIGSKLYFTAFDPANGFELRWIDTSLTTPVVNTVSIVAGPDSSNPGEFGGFFVMGTKLFFDATDPTRGNELRWIDTSLPSPVVNTISIAVGGNSSNARSFAAVGNKLFFNATDPSRGMEVRWIDTTLASPTVNTIEFRNGSSGSVNDGKFAVVGSKIYFGASTTSTDFTLRWADTSLPNFGVNTVFFGTSSNGILNGPLVAVGSTLFFNGAVGSSSRLSWIDTNAAQPVVQTIQDATGSLFFQPTQLTAVGTKLYFSAEQGPDGRQLRVLDTTQLDLPPQSILLANSSLNADPGAFSGLKVVGSKLFFNAKDASNGYELRWIETSVNVPTIRTLSIAPGTMDSYAGVNGGFNVVGARLYFTAQDGSADYDLYWVDGQAITPSLNRIGISTDSASSSPGFFPVSTVGNKVLFTATDSTFGNEVRWIDTVSAPTTVNTFDVAPGADWSYPSRSNSFLIGDKFYFTASDSSGAAVRWFNALDPAPILRTINDDFASSIHVAIGNLLYSVDLENPAGSRLKWIDTTLADPIVHTKLLGSGVQVSIDGPYTTVGTKLFFSASDASNGSELRWLDTAETSPTIRTISINQGTGNAFAGRYSGMAALGNKLFFEAYDPGYGYELRWIDTSVENPPVNTIELHSGVETGFQGDLGNFTAIGSKLYFNGRDNTYGTEPRWIDTTLASPAINTIDIQSGSSSSLFLTRSAQFTTIGTKLYFVSNSGLKWFDTSQASPVINPINLANSPAFPNDPEFDNFSVIGDRLYFAATDSIIGHQLRWVDTTLAVQSINTANVSSGPDGSAGKAVSVGTKVYFSGSKPGYGTELFLTSTLETPDDISLSNSTIPENSAPNAVVGGFTTQDLNLEDLFTYLLVTGPGSDDNNKFAIDSLGSLQAPLGFDFESKSSYSIRVRSTDSSGLFLDKVFAVTVTNVNEAPIVVNDSYAANENTILNVTNTSGLLINDADPEQDPITVTQINGIATPTATGSVVILPSGASLTIYSTGRFVYDPRIAFNYLSTAETAIDTFTYSVTAGGLTSVATVTITVTGTNDAPTAARVDGRTNEDGPSSVVTAIVTDSDSADTFTYTIATPTTKGLVTYLGNGNFAYSPNGAFESLATGQTVTDVFAYTANDGHGGTATASVVMTIRGQNDVPLAVEDLATTNENTAKTISVLTNDTDVDATDLPTNFILASASIRSTAGLSASPNSAGTVSIVANKLVFTPGTAFDELALGSTATVTIDYTMSDDEGLTSSSSVVLTVTGLNDAPALSTTPVVTFDAIDEDATNNIGNTVASLAQGLSDLDIGGLDGIAVTGVTGLASGSWQYSLNSGTSWLPLGTVTSTAARLLSAEGDSNRIRFVPALNFTGTVQITYRAWDQTRGVIGGTADVSTNILTGGSTAYSTLIKTATLQVKPLNDAPVLINSPGPQLTPIAEDLLTSSGNTIVSIIGTSVIDPDANAKRGIAVVGTSNPPNGIWQYTLDSGTTWLPLGTVTPTAARLLPMNGGLSKLRFAPAANFNGTVQLSYKAWDQTQGTAGGTADLSLPASSGGLTAYSTDIATASLLVTPINDAPVLATSPAPSFVPIDEDNFTSSGTLISSLIGTSISDNDLTQQNSPLNGIAIVGVTGTTTGWQYSLDNGSSWITLGSPTITTAKLLPNTVQTRLRYVPNSHFNGPVTVTYRAWDQTSGTIGGTADLSLTGTSGGTTAYSTAKAVATLTVRSVNDAPSWKTTANPQLLSIKEDEFNSLGTTIASIVQGAIDDPDASPLSGIAVNGFTGSTLGKWQYTLNGGTNWTDLLTATPSTARLLPANGNMSKIRFVPITNQFGSAELRFYAWDQTTGTAGATGDASTTSKRGGITAFSTVSKTATLTITSVNDAPVLNTSTVRVLGTTSQSTIDPNLNPLPGKSFFVSSLLNGISTDVDASSQMGIAIVGVAPSTRGVWWYTFDDLTFIAINTASSTSALLLPANARLQFVPKPGFVTTSTVKATLLYRSWDQTFGNPRDIVNLTTAGMLGPTSAFSAAVGTAEITVTP